MTLQEERDALQKRMDEIDAEIAGFVPGWYVCRDNDIAIIESVRLRNIKTLEKYKEEEPIWAFVEPFHLVAHKFLPEGWRVVGPEAKTLYDWSQAPEWANWAATNEDGEVWWHERKPEILERDDYLWFDKKRCELAGESIKLRSVPWDQSLEQRPGITQ